MTRVYLIAEIFELSTSKGLKAVSVIYIQKNYYVFQ